MASNGDLSGVVKRIRQQSGLSQEKFAQLTGIATQTIARFERGKQQPRDPRVRELLRQAAISVGLQTEAESFQEATTGLPMSRLVSETTCRFFWEKIADTALGCLLADPDVPDEDAVAKAVGIADKMAACWENRFGMARQ